MARWDAANEARSALADGKRARLVASLSVSRSFKEAAWRAGIPVRTASRLLPVSERP